jgi:NitT/TauT family transport system substrate-binding protein
MIRRSTFVTTAGAAIAALSTSYPAFADEEIRVGTTTADDGTPLLYAQQAGIFKKLGLDIHLQVLASGGAGAPAVIGGALDTSRTSLMALINAHTRSIPLKIIAPGGLYESTKLFAAMVVPKNSPIRTIADLSGKTVGTFALRDLNQLSAMAWIDRNGGNSSTVRFVEISVNAAVAALQAGKLDAATLLSPTLDAAVRADEVRVIGPVWNGIANRFLISAWYATEDYVAKNTDTVKRFITGLREGATYCIAHPNDTLPLIAKFENLDPSTLRGSVRSSWQTVLDVAEIQPVIDLAAKYKFIDQPFPAKDLVSPIALAR